MSWRHKSRDRFDYYRSLEARRDSQGECGHEIKRGDLIGWNGTLRKARCADCWARWVVENLGEVTDHDIERLRADAWEHMDYEQVAMCDRAMRGCVVSRQACEEIIQDTRYLDEGFGGGW